MVILDEYWTHACLTGPRPLLGFAPIHYQYIFHRNYDHCGFRNQVVRSYLEAYWEQLTCNERLSRTTASRDGG